MNERAPRWAAAPEVYPVKSLGARRRVLLLLTTNMLDGAAVTPTVAVHFWKITDGLLLVDPFVEVQ